MTPDQHLTIAIIIAVPTVLLVGALIWLRWDDVRRIK